jgi:hypothetical protein
VSTIKLYVEELATMATVYRDMALETNDPRLALRFAERASMYDTAVEALSRLVALK